MQRGIENKHATDTMLTQTDRAMGSINGVRAELREIRPEWIRMASPEQRASLKSSLGRYEESMEANNERFVNFLSGRVGRMRDEVYDNPAVQGAHEMRQASLREFAADLQSSGQQIREMLDSAASN